MTGRYPRSANGDPLAGEDAYSAAGWVWIEPGRVRFPNRLAARRAGTIVDLSAAARARREGNLQAARARLEFARDVRLLLT